MSADGRRTAAQIIAERLRRPGYRARVDAKCVDCIYDEAAPGTWRAQVRACTATGCPLWAVRSGARGLPGHSSEEESDD
jgi:hypothetical protein